VLPNIDAANIAYNLLKTAAGGGIAHRPGAAGRGQAGAHPHAVGHGARIVNMTALTVADANATR
jgi:malate dehydrogenase (oxaloacetate-decarboxylating)(NADP+)